MSILSMSMPAVLRPRSLFLMCLGLLFVSSMLMTSNATKTVYGDCASEGCPLTMDPVCDVTQQVTYQNECLAHCQPLLVTLTTLKQGPCSNTRSLPFDDTATTTTTTTTMDIHMYSRYCSVYSLPLEYIQQSRSQHIHIIHIFKVSSVQQMQFF